MAPSGSALTRFDCTQFLYYNLLEIYMGASSCLGLTEKKKVVPWNTFLPLWFWNDLDESNQLLDKNHQNLMKLR